MKNKNNNNNNYDQWLNKTIIEKTEQDKFSRREDEKEVINKEAVGNTRQDMSRPLLEKLQNDGYEECIWNSGNSEHSICLELHDQVWRLDEFLAQTEYDAPIFFRSHPGDTNCGVIVRGPDLPDVFVDSFGNLSEL